MNDDLKNAIYDILVEEAGAWEKSRQRFIDNWPTYYNEPGIRETLGTSAAIWYQPNSTPPLFVTTNRIDSSPEREAIIQKTNARLAELMEGVK